MQTSTMLTSFFKEVAKTRHQHSYNYCTSIPLHLCLQGRKDQSSPCFTEWVQCSAHVVKLSISFWECMQVYQLLQIQMSKNKTLTQAYSTNTTTNLIPHRGPFTTKILSCRPLHAPYSESEMYYNHDTKKESKQITTGPDCNGWQTESGSVCALM